MTGPLDAVTAIHNAFRADIKMIDDAALKLARGDDGAGVKLERYRFFNEILSWHAKGEELAMFPLLEGIAPSVAEAYERDHRGLEAAYDALDGAVYAGDSVAIGRASAAFRFHSDIHLRKEDAHLYRILKEQASAPQLAEAVGVMSGTIPKDRFPEVVAWLFPLIGADDRENMTRIWQMVMPAPVFENVEKLIHQAIGDEWAELTRRIPTLRIAS